MDVGGDMHAMTNSGGDSDDDFGDFAKAEAGNDDGSGVFAVNDATQEPDGFVFGDFASSVGFASEAEEFSSGKPIDVAAATPQTEDRLKQEDDFGVRGATLSQETEPFQETTLESSGFDAAQDLQFSDEATRRDLDPSDSASFDGNPDIQTCQPYETQAQDTTFKEGRSGFDDIPNQQGDVALHADASKPGNGLDEKSASETNDEGSTTKEDDHIRDIQESDASETSNNDNMGDTNAIDTDVHEPSKLSEQARTTRGAEKASADHEIRVDNGIVDGDGDSQIDQSHATMSSTFKETSAREDDPAGQETVDDEDESGEIANVAKLAEDSNDKAVETIGEDQFDNAELEFPGNEFGEFSSATELTRSEQNSSSSDFAHASTPSPDSAYHNEGSDDDDDDDDEGFGDFSGAGKPAEDIDNKAESHLAWTSSNGDDGDQETELDDFNGDEASNELDFGDFAQAETGTVDSFSNFPSSTTTDDEDAFGFADFGQFKEEPDISSMLVCTDAELEEAFGKIDSQIKTSEGESVVELRRLLFSPERQYETGDYFGPSKCKTCNAMFRYYSSICLYCGTRILFGQASGKIDRKAISKAIEHAVGMERCKAFEDEYYKLINHKMEDEKIAKILGESSEAMADTLKLGEDHPNELEQTDVSLSMSPEAPPMSVDDGGSSEQDRASKTDWNPLLNPDTQEDVEVTIVRHEIMSVNIASTGSNFGSSRDGDLLSMTLMGMGIEDGNEKTRTGNAEGFTLDQDTRARRGSSTSGTPTGQLSSAGSRLLGRLLAAWGKPSSNLSNDEDNTKPLEGSLPDLSFMQSSILSAPPGTNVSVSTSKRSSSDDPFLDLLE